MTEIKNRGVNDILIAIIDGLKGFPEAINSVFPETQIQTCIVHLIRNSLDFCSWKERKPVAKELKTIDHAADAEAAAAALRDFDDRSLGPEICGDHGPVAPALGTCHPLLRVSPGGAEVDLHHG